MTQNSALFTGYKFGINLKASSRLKAKKFILAGGRYAKK
jgi:hypothetical protein